MGEGLLLALDNGLFVGPCLGGSIIKMSDHTFCWNLFQFVLGPLESCSGSKRLSSLWPIEYLQPIVVKTYKKLTGSPSFTALAAASLSLNNRGKKLV